MKTLRTMTAIAVGLLLTASAALGQVSTPDQIKTPPLRKFSMPQPKRVQLGNGMVIFLQEDHELPLVRGSALIRGGSRDLPADKAGMLSIYTQSWRTGGTASRSGDELDQFLEARAARVETGGGVDSTSVSMDVLKADFDTVFPIWLDVLRNPAFRQEKIDLAKTQANTGISRRNDEPGGILARESAKLGYGADSPYTRQAEYATIASITRDDLLAFHKRFVHPNNIIVSFIGDFDAAQVEKKLRDAFNGWPRGPQAPPPPVTVTPAKPGVYFVPKDDVTQANIAMVHPGITRNNPDYHALVVMNEIFSGGFSGRLMQRLRSERGLTYGVGGGVGANWDYPGLFRVQMATKSGTTLESIEALRGEVTRLINDPVTDAELSLAKESILNAFVFTMDTRAKALNQQVLLEFYGFPSDYFVKYPTLIQQVKAEDVRRVAQKYVHPNQLALLVVGKEAEFEKPLSTLGTVTTIDISIPEPGANPGEKKAAPSGSNAEGVALVNKVAEFVGGKARIDAVNAVQRTGSMTMKTPQGEMQADIVAVTQYPSSQRVVMNMPMGQITRVVTPSAAWMVTPMGTQDLPSSQRDSSLGELRADLITVLKNIDNPKYTFTATGTEKVGDVNARIVEINADGTNVKWYVDPSTGKLLRTVSRAGAPMPGDVITDNVEWKSFDGLNVPVTATITRNGEKAGEMKATMIQVNPTVEAGSFDKPAAK
ncbi:MAG TPA: pitrilysin family protein [Thermoanaerobaculia bacterium]|nr:pitrilysin family protein [Thermoanaerobaculia bacterium]